jgi:Ca-activated chloride channel family protein
MLISSRPIVAVLMAAAAVAVVSAHSPQTVFKGGVDIVTVTATVTDGDGRFVSKLTQEDFIVNDNGRPQEIVNFSSERVPVSLGIVLDVSASMTAEKMAAAKIAINRFVFDLLGKDDELFLAEFGRATQMLQTWTVDRGTFSRALDRTKVQYGTALYDAVLTTLPVASTGMHTKKALLVLSDGDDRNSRTTVKNLQDRIRASEVLVYALGVEGDEDVNAGALRKLTDDTGGRTEIVHGFRNLDSATSRLADELNQQYVIGYATPPGTKGQWHAIKVEVRKRGLKIRARSGYVAS